MKKALFPILVLILAIIAIRGCFANWESDIDKAKQIFGEFQEFNDLIFDENLVAAKSFVDSLRLKEGVPDSVLQKFDNEITFLEEKIAEREKAKKRLVELRAKKDEFNGLTFYYDKSSPKFVNQNGIYLYFAVNNEGRAENLRFKIQYFSTEWLFIEKVLFLIDGETFEYAPGVWERDNDSDIWEYNDSGVNLDSYAIIDALIGSKEAKVRFIGQQYYKDKVISTSQRAAMKRVLEIYQGISGETY